MKIVSLGNRHCASCIGALSFAIVNVSVIGCHVAVHHN